MELEKNQMSKKQLTATAVKILKHVAARYSIGQDPVMVKPEYSDDRSEVRFWINSRWLEDFFQITRMLGLTSILYTHKNAQYYKALTGKESLEGYRNFLKVGII